MNMNHVNDPWITKILLVMDVLTFLSDKFQIFLPSVPSLKLPEAMKIFREQGKGEE